MFIRRASLAVVALGLAACDFSGRIAKDAVEYNARLAESQNEQLLLNIARASRKHPLYFTAITSVTRGISSKVSLAAKVEFGESLAFGGSKDKPGEIGPGAEMSGGPSLQMGVLDSEKFMRGIMTPIGMDQVEYFWNQGWPREILLFMLFRRILVGEREYVCQPVEVERDGCWAVSAECEHYHNLVRILSLFRTLEWDDTPGKPVGDPLPIGKGEGDLMGAGVEAAKAGLGYSVAGKAVTIRGKSKKSWRLKNPGWADWQGSKPQEYAALLAMPEFQALFGKVGEKSAPPSELRFVNATEAQEAKAASAGATKSPPAAGEQRVPAFELRAYLRSPEAILYHLGELARAERKIGSAPIRLYAKIGGDAGSSELPPLFSANSCRQGCCGASVEYCGERFHVNGDCEHDESMHVLSLLTQLINLQKSADELPKTGVVTLAGN